MASYLNFITGDILVSGQDSNPRPICHVRSTVSLNLVVCTRRHVLCRDSLGSLRAIREAETGLSRETRWFHGSCLDWPGSMGSILCDALGLDEIDHNSASRVASRLLDYVYETGALDLVAEFEVVCNQIVEAEEEEVHEKEVVELGVCSICLDDLCGNMIRATCCSNRFHEECIVRWMERKKDSCPLCRRKVL